MVNWGGHRVALYDACEAEGLFQPENGLNGLGLRTSGNVSTHRDACPTPIKFPHAHRCFKFFEASPKVLGEGVTVSYLPGPGAVLPGTQVPSISVVFGWSGTPVSLRCNWPMIMSTAAAATWREF